MLKFFRGRLPRAIALRFFRRDSTTCLIKCPANSLLAGGIVPRNLRNGLLLQIMQRLGDLRDEYPNLVTTPDLYALATDVASSEGELQALHYLDRHLLFLRDRGYVDIGNLTVGGHRWIRLTAQGEMFLQPELAEFGQEPLLPRVVTSIESQILTYPDENRNGFLFELREAIARNRAELIARLLVEVLPRLVTPKS
jgi:hypothetical protein